ncbi:MAG: DUF2442 domain-containing protein [Chloroflexota bacterium]
MSLSTHDVATSPNNKNFQAEVTNISAFGFWLLVGDEEYFVPFTDYPVFKQATITQIYEMVVLSPTQYHWPQLDVDIELTALQHPEKFPLYFR